MYEVIDCVADMTVFKDADEGKVRAECMRLGGRPKGFIVSQEPETINKDAKKNEAPELF